MNQCSDELKRFFQMWYDCSQGKEPYLPFYDCVGLCSNLNDFTNDITLHDELGDLLYKQYEKNPYPFGGCHTYGCDASNSIMHKNPQRIAFVKQFLED